MWIGRAAEELCGGTVVVTGASSGIGRAFAEGIGAPGTRIVLLARRAHLLDEVAAHLRERGATVLTQAVDLRDLEAAGQAAHDAVEAFGAPDLVVACAGHSIARGVLATAPRPDTVARLTAVNHTGAVTHLLPLIAAMADAGRGQVVGVTTANARLAVPGWGAYTASKAAFDAWLASARPELGPLGIATSIVALPLVATEMVDARRRSSGMSVAAAADWIAKASVTRQARVAPWWLRPAEVVHAMAPAAVASLIGRYSRG